MRSLRRALARSTNMDRRLSVAPAGRVRRPAASLGIAALEGEQLASMRPLAVSRAANRVRAARPAGQSPGQLAENLAASSPATRITPRWFRGSRRPGAGVDGAGCRRSCAELLMPCQFLLRAAGLCVVFSFAGAHCRDRCRGRAGWLQAPLTLAANQSLEPEIEPGITCRAPWPAPWFRPGCRPMPARCIGVSPVGMDRGIKAGIGEIFGTSPFELLQKLVRRGGAARRILGRGLNFPSAAPGPGTRRAAQTRDRGLERCRYHGPPWACWLGRRGPFLPDTYTCRHKGSSAICQPCRALHAMMMPGAAWAQRAPDTPLKSADQALIPPALSRRNCRAEDQCPGRRRVHQPPACGHAAAADRPYGDLRPGRKI